MNIRNDDIVNGNAKLTLGLIWSIISHYQVKIFQILCSVSQFKAYQVLNSFTSVVHG